MIPKKYCERFEIEKIKISARKLVSQKKRESKAIFFLSGMKKCVARIHVWHDICCLLCILYCGDCHKYRTPHWAFFGIQGTLEKAVRKSQRNRN